jgi:hypothetical protein
MAFALLVLSGTMTDRCAAEAVGLNPDSAAYTKSKPHVRAYMHEHRAAVEEKLVQQEADKLHRLNLDREQVLARLWEIASMNPEMTRGSITGQVKAISMIVAMQNFIPGRQAVSEKKSPTASAHPQIDPSAWLGRPAVGQTGQQATTTEPPPSPAPLVPPAPASRGAEEAPPAPGHSQSTFANCAIPSEVPELHVPLFASLPDMRVPFSIKKTPFNPFVRPR